MVLFFGDPLSSLDKFLDFTPLVTVFVWFIRLVSDLTEGMFGVSDDIIDLIERFCHSLLILSERLSAYSVPAPQTVV
jgi:hypothetical protein